MPLFYGSSSKMMKLNVKRKTNWNRRLFEEPLFEDNLPPCHVVNTILNKDIFNESDLEKMTPDFKPTNLVLRMEVRSSMVRDRHIHAAANKNNAKAKFQGHHSLKEISRVSHELSKIKQNLKSKNMKNNIMVKHLSHNKNDSVMVKEKKNLTDDFETAFKKNELSFITVLEKNLNSEREICSEINESCKYDTEINMPNNENNSVNEKLEKVVSSSDDIEDLQTALTLMTLYSSNEDTHIIENNRNEGQTENKVLPVLVQEESPIFDNDTSAGITDNMENANFLQICSLSNIAREEYLAQKYFDNWSKFVQRKKGMSELRIEKLNNFFDKLMEQKCQSDKSKGQSIVKSKSVKNKIARDQSSYQHRYQVQKNIIALQKLKLEEQNRVIEELKYKHIVEATKESAENMREALQGTFLEMDRRMKPKIKVLTNELKLHEIEEPTLVLHCLKVPQFLQRMERRAREREEKHALIRERRRQIEEERLRMKQQAELAKAEMDKEEKAHIMKQLKDKRKQEKIESIRRKQHTEKMRALRVMADIHYERNLLWRCGLRPWLRLTEMKRHNAAKAESHYKFQLKKNVFLHWLWHTEDMWMERNYKAEVCYRKKMLKKTFDALKMNHQELVLKQQVADDYYDLYVQQLVFRKFRENILLLQGERELKYQAAVRYYESNMKFRILAHWRVLPALNKLQRERDARKTRWRQKVLQVVPDYSPPDDEYVD